MLENKIKTGFANGQPVINGWLSIPDAFAAEVVSMQGYDSVTVDMQHGVVGYSEMRNMVQAMQHCNVAPMVRVPWLDPGIIMKCLDAGAYGIICPMVNTAAQAAELVSAMRYPPQGSRSFGPTRPLVTYGSDYYQHANAQVTVFAMIETAEAVANVDEIAATPGLDGLYIGPADLTLGVTNGRLPPGLDREEDEMLEVIHRIRDTAHKHGIKACLHTGSPDYAAKAVGWGFDLVTLPNDVRILASTAAAQVARTRELLDGSAVAADSSADKGY